MTQKSSSSSGRRKLLYERDFLEYGIGGFDLPIRSNSNIFIKKRIFTELSIAMCVKIGLWCGMLVQKFPAQTILHTGLDFLPFPRDSPNLANYILRTYEGTLLSFFVSGYAPTLLRAKFSLRVLWIPTQQLDLAPPCKFYPTPEENEKTLLSPSSSSCEPSIGVICFLLLLLPTRFSSHDDGGCSRWKWKGMIQ